MTADPVRAALEKWVYMFLPVAVPDTEGYDLIVESLAALNAPATAPVPKYALGYGDSNPDYLDGIEGVALDPFDDNENIWPRLFVATTEEHDPRVERVLTRLNATATPAPDLTAALKHIVALANEWEANGLGGVAVQRKRWQKLGEIARAALPKDTTP
jgi:hypothetical protein